MRRIVTDDLEALLEALPPHVAGPLTQREDKGELLEVVLDLGRLPEARFPTQEVVLSNQEVTQEDIDYVVSRIGAFGDDNRAGIERTLHRISAIRNRSGKIIGLSCRVGRAVFGTVELIRDLVESGKSIMLLGRPGVGKTTMLREVARVLADELGKRVMVVDTSNEIAGDGDIPHPAIGHARRMQVPTPQLQHQVMIEAVENHMPEVIIIDEMGTELEAQAARTIAERGVQLIATAHGNTLENLILNPTLCDLVGGIQTVTLSDEEARRRGTQKSILERKAPPTFDVLVEIQTWDRVCIYPDVASTVDAMLRGRDFQVEVRWVDEDGEIRKESRMYSSSALSTASLGRHLPAKLTSKRIFPFGIERERLEKVARRLGLPIELVSDVQEADLLLITKNHYRRTPQVIRAAETLGLPIYVLRSNTLIQIEQGLADIYELPKHEDSISQALEEVEEAIQRIRAGQDSLELSPQNSFIRRLQHQLAGKYDLRSRSVGREPERRLRIFR